MSWYLGLKCDACPEMLGDCDVRHRDRGELRAVALDLIACARATGWEEINSPDDGRRWYCPACKRARAGVGLAAATAGGE